MRKTFTEGKTTVCGLVNSWYFSLYDLGKALSGLLMQLESGTRVSLNALSPPKTLSDEGLDFHIF